MKWLDFSSYVMPYVTGVPEPLLEQHARKICIEFCRKTLCYQVTLDRMETDGTPIVDMLFGLPSETQIVKIKSVTVDDHQWDIKDAITGIRLENAEAYHDFCYTQNNRDLIVYPTQARGVEVYVVAALMPTINSACLGDLLFEQYVYDIAPGIIASLKRIPNQSFTDMGNYPVHQAEFESRLRSIAMKVSRGLAAAKMPAYTGYV